MRIETYQLADKEIKIPVAESYRDCVTLIKSDEARIFPREKSFLSIAWRALKPHGNSVLFWFRLAAYNGFAGRFCRFMYTRACQRHCIDMQAETKVGYGLYIGHGICMIINGGTIIGNNVNLSHFLSIGTNHGTPAIIGDEVYVGPHVSIVEDVRIGSRSTIGAGAVVTRDVPEGATAAGVPARVLNHNAPARYILNRYPC